MEKENLINLELYHAHLETNGVQMKKKVNDDNSNISRNQLYKVYVEKVEKKGKMQEKSFEK